MGRTDILLFLETKYFCDCLYRKGMEGFLKTISFFVSLDQMIDKTVFPYSPLTLSGEWHSCFQLSVIVYFTFFFIPVYFPIILIIV